MHVSDWTIPLWYPFTSLLRQAVVFEKALTKAAQKVGFEKLSQEQTEAIILPFLEDKMLSCRSSFVSWMWLGQTHTCRPELDSVSSTLKTDALRPDCQTIWSCLNASEARLADEKGSFLPSWSKCSRMIAKSRGHKMLSNAGIVEWVQKNVGEAMPLLFICKRTKATCTLHPRQASLNHIVSSRPLCLWWSQEPAISWASFPK